MKISVNWLKKYTKIDLPIEKLVAEIGSKLVEVEGVENLGEKYKDVLIVKAVECYPHQDSDHLSVVKIDDGGVRSELERDENGLVQVVCGAPNIKAGMTVAWLPPTSVVPESFNDDQPFVLNARKLRGVMSNGMIASARELDLWQEHDGILEITDEIKAGTSFAEFYELDDYILDIENKSLTHRPDCFGMIGFAREVAAILGQKFESPDYFGTVFDEYNQKVKIEVDSEVCQGFNAAVIEDISKLRGLNLLQKTYLARSGVKPVDDIVDISNYVMLETGQPTHVYDYDKMVELNGDENLELSVRRSKKGEKLTLLDGQTVELNDDIVICLNNKPITLAGIMGGESTKVDQNTKRILIESATFNLYKMRNSQMRHGIFSEALTRFTKGQPVGGLQAALLRNLKMMNLKGNFSVSNCQSNDTEKISFNIELINTYLGTNYTEELIKNTLKNVELDVEIKDGIISVEKPWWRTDLNNSIEIIEEIGRINGYDNIKLSLPTRKTSANLETVWDKMRQDFRYKLYSCGANEVMNYSFVPKSLILKAKQDPENSYQIINSISPELECYRQSLTPSLLDKVYSNIRAGHNQFAIFELAKVHNKLFGQTADNVPVEKTNLALVVTDKKSKDSAYYLAKKYLDKLLTDFNIEYKIEPIDDADEINQIFESRRAAQVVIDGQVVGVVGEFENPVKSDFKLPQSTAGFELNLDKILSSYKNAKPSINKVYTLPSMSRDFCFEVKKDLKYQDLYQNIEQIVSKFKEIDFTIVPIDFYSDNEAKKRITIRLTLNPTIETLTTKKVDGIMIGILKNLKQKVEFEVI